MLVALFVMRLLLVFVCLFVHLVEFIMLYRFFSNVNFKGGCEKKNITFSWQKIEWWLKLLALEYFILLFQFCVSFLVCFSLVCFSDKMNFLHFFSIVHLLRSVHEICLEGPTAEHAAVCVPFLKRIRTTLSTIAFLWLPVCTELPLQSVIISLEAWGNL